MWQISPQTHLDREDESRQSEAEGVCVDKAAEGPDDVVLGGLRADVHSGVLNHCVSPRLSREPIIPLLQGNSLTRVTCRIHRCYLNLEYMLQEDVQEPKCLCEWCVWISFLRFSCFFWGAEEYMTSAFLRKCPEKFVPSLFKIFLIWHISSQPKILGVTLDDFWTAF